MKKHTYFVALSLLVLCACVKEMPLKQDAESEEIPSAIVENATPGMLTVAFDDSMLSLIEEELESGSAPTKSPALAALLQDLGAVSLERVFPYAGEYEERTRREGLHRFYNVRFVEDIPVTKAAEGAMNVPGITLAEPARRMRRRAVFNDPYLSRQWHYINTTKEGVDINVEEVWSNYCTGSANVIVSVVDEGVCYTHPDLAANMWDDGSGHHGYNFVKGDYNLSWTSSADTGHGTHVAGTISAVNNNGVGLCGIAGGDSANGVGGVRLMSCQIFAGNDGLPDSGCANAIKWGADHGALISQNSWGDYADTNEDGVVSAQELSYFKSLTISSAMKAGIDYFIKYAGCDNNGNQKADSPMKGGLVIFASGNENIDYDPICAYDPVISVSAFNQNGKKASYSNYGDWVDIAAPGGEGYGSSDSIWSTLPTNVASSGYGGSGWAGTSMACPHVSGVAALLVSYFGGPGFTAGNCREMLLGGAVADYFTGSKKIGPKLDALGAFEFNGANPKAPKFTWTTQLPAQIKAHENATGSFSVLHPDGKSFTVKVEEAPAGFHLSDNGDGKYTIAVTGPESQSGLHNVVISATDSDAASTTLSFTYTVLENHAPEVSTSFIKHILVRMNEVYSLNLDNVFSDPDGESLSYVLEDSGNSDAFEGMISSFNFFFKGLKSGTIPVRLSASDLLGAKTTMNLEFIVKDPNNPVDVYPTSTSDNLTVRTDTSELVKVKATVLSASGAEVLRTEFLSSVYRPYTLSVKALAPGRYVLVTEYGQVRQRSTFMKI